jgi:hypothetical protein
MEALYIYTGEGMARVFAGEIGRYKSTRFTVQNHIASAGWANAKSDRCYFLAEDTCTEALVIPEEIRGRIGIDYGRDQGIGWYGLGGFGLTNPDDLDPRVIKWGSRGEA